MPNDIINEKDILKKIPMGNDTFTLLKTIIEIRYWPRMPCMPRHH